MKINLVWNTRSSKWGKRTEDYNKGWKIQQTAQKEKQCMDMCTGNRWQHSTEKHRFLHILNP